jgi:rubrerythrin|tara:strand:+ start:354 stop:620 length:267 start_codon:yes stop_codon:yes gene_type:complete
MKKDIDEKTISIFEETMANEIEHMANVQHLVDKMSKKQKLQEPLFYMFLLRVCMRKIYQNVNEEIYSDTIYQIMQDVAETEMFDKQLN